MALFGYLLSLEDEKISGQTFQTQQIVPVGTDLDLVGETAVIFSYNLVLENKVNLNLWLRSFFFLF